MRKVKQNPESSSPKLAPGIKNYFNISISASSVRNCLRANELRGRTACRICFISEKKPKEKINLGKTYINTPKNFGKR